MKRHSGQFKLGNNANPHGRPKVPEELKQMRRLTGEKFLKMMNKYLFMNAKELAATAKDDINIPSIELCLISIIQECRKKGDYSRLEFFVNRLIGSVKLKIDHSSTDGSMSPKSAIDISKLTDEQLNTLDTIFKNQNDSKLPDNSSTNN